MANKTLKTRLMDFCEWFGTGAEFTWSQLHEFMVLETLASKPEKTKCFYSERVPEEFRKRHFIDTDGTVYPNMVVLTYKECFDLYFKCPRIFRGFMSSPLDNPGGYSARCGNNYMRRPSKNEPRYLVKNSNGKYVLACAA